MKQTANSRLRQLTRTSPLSQFFSRHDDGHRSGFITRLDRSPVTAKRLTFITAFALNVIILVFITCILALSFIGEFIYMGPTSFSSRLSVWTIQNIIVAAAISILLQSTTIPFFFGECRLRILHGFRPSEVIIRKSPNINRQTHVTEEQHLQHYWRIAIRAINPKLLYSTASAMLSSDYWTVEYSAVLDVLQRISANEIDEQDMEFAIWKQNSENVWSVYELWRVHEIMTDQQEIVMFKTFLTQSGKKELLKIWEDRTFSVKGANRLSSPHSYQTMVDQFAREGLDYDTLWSQLSDRTV